MAAGVGWDDLGLGSAGEEKEEKPEDGLDGFHAVLRIAYSGPYPGTEAPMPWERHPPEWHPLYGAAARWLIPGGRSGLLFIERDQFPDQILAVGGDGEGNAPAFIRYDEDEGIMNDE